MLILFAIFALAYGVLDLTYFDARGRAEQFRLFFADQKVMYNDIRLTGAQFEARKTSFPWGHVPVVNMTEHPAYLADTAALVVFIGKRHNMWPTDDYTEEMLLDYSGASEDLRLQKNDILGTGDTPVDPNIQKTFLPILQEWLFYMERNLATSPYSNIGPFLLGMMFTPVDCRVWDVMDQIHSNMDKYPNVYDPFVLTQRFRVAVAARPNIAAYLKTRK